MDKKGFTIIELLVVIAVIGMLVSVVLTSTSGTKQKARDVKREEHMKQLQIALDLYHTGQQRLPVCVSEVVINGQTDCLSAALLSEGAVSGAVGLDPLGGSTGICGGAGSYVYCYQSSNGSTYTVSYNLEGNNIPGKIAGWQSVGP